MTDAVEAVARAICEASQARWRTGAGLREPFKADADAMNNHWRHKAHAAIAAHTQYLIENAGEVDDEAARWLSNLELETSGALLPPVEGLILGGDVFKLTELQDLLERQAATIAALRAEIERQA